MLYYEVLFLLIAIVAAVLGFGDLAAKSAAIMKTLFFVFLLVFLISLVLQLGRRV